MPPDSQLLAFVEVASFDRSRAEISEEALRRVQNELQKDPYAGELVAGTGSVRKIRVAASGRGKRGGARILYYYVDRQLTVYLLLAYTKNKKSDITKEEKAMLRRLVDAIERSVSRARRG